MKLYRYINLQLWRDRIKYHLFRVKFLDDAARHRSLSLNPDRPPPVYVYIHTYTHIYTVPTATTTLERTRSTMKTCSWRTADHLLRYRIREQWTGPAGMSSVKRRWRHFTPAAAARSEKRERNSRERKKNKRKKNKNAYCTHCIRKRQ